MGESSQVLNIVITGGSSGIGEAVVLELANNHHRFFLVGRNRDRLDKVVNKTSKLGGEAFYGIGDVGDEKDVDRLFEKAIKKNSPK